MLPTVSGFPGGLGMVAYLGMKTGDIRRAVFPTDSQVSTRFWVSGLIT